MTGLLFDLIPAVIGLLATLVAKFAIDKVAKWKIKQVKSYVVRLPEGGRRVVTVAGAPNDSQVRSAVKKELMVEDAFRRFLRVHSASDEIEILGKAPLLDILGNIGGKWIGVEIKSHIDRDVLVKIAQSLPFNYRLDKLFLISLDGISQAVRQAAIEFQFPETISVIDFSSIHSQEDANRSIEKLLSDIPNDGVRK